MIFESDSREGGVVNLMSLKILADLQVWIEARNVSKCPMRWSRWHGTRDESEVRKLRFND